MNYNPSVDTLFTNNSFCKLDVHRFDLSKISDGIYDGTLTNSISWDVMDFRATREELKCLADFINQYLENNS